MADNIKKYFTEEQYDSIRREYSIPEELFTGKVKRGLRNSDGTGVTAGVTKIGRVIGYNYDKINGDVIPAPGQLYYRSYNMEDIVGNHIRNRTFGYEEVAYLLLFGKLPNAEEYKQFDKVLSCARKLPDNFTEDVILKCPSSNVMNKLSRAVMTLYSYDPNPDDTSLENMLRQSIELIARFPIIVANAYSAKRHYFDGKSLYIHYPDEKLSVAENFLRMLREDASYTADEAHLLDVLMMLHAEHGAGNNSSFVCRALSSTGTDTYSAIAGAVNSLKGPLHGGANAKVNALVESVKANVADPTDDSAMRDYLKLVLDKKAGDGSGKIYGLGHAVYTMSDPRAEILKVYSRKMAEDKGMIADFEYLQSMERNGIELLSDYKKLNKPVCANVDLYSGFVIQMLGIPNDLYTPLFAISRIAGWCAHRIEEALTGNRIMRPAYRNAMVFEPYVEMENRK